MSQHLCVEKCENIDTVNRIKDEMPIEDNFYDMSNFFKAFADKTRLKILHSLLNERLCVCDIASILEMSHSAVSHQLRGLRQSRLVKSEKVGKNVYYHLCDDHIESIIKFGLEHINE